MKSIASLIAVCVALFGAFALAQSSPISNAQNSGATNSHVPRYIVTDLGTLLGGGGGFNDAIWITNGGLTTGWSALPGGNAHSVLWNQGTITDLGTLGGPNSNGWGANQKGQAAGESDTGTSDPNGEDFCGFFTHLICRGYVWQNGAMTPLPTLGGNNSFGGQINNRGQVAGYAENSKRDPSCPAPQVFQFKPVVFESNGGVSALSLLPGDREGAAFGINENGQAVGTSGTCGALNLDFVYLAETHAVSWKNGKATDLGNLGGMGAGSFGNAAYSVNDRGDVVGHSALPGGTTQHAFLWTKQTGMQDLGTLRGDAQSYALDINNAGEIVGTSWETVSYVGPHATIWENGVAVNLNSLVIPGRDAGLYLAQAQSINDRGEIVGWALTSAGDFRPFLATLLHGADALPLSPALEPPALSDAARKLLERMGRFGGRGMPPQ